MYAFYCNFSCVYKSRIQPSPLCCWLRFLADPPKHRPGGPGAWLSSTLHSENTLKRPICTSQNAWPAAGPKPLLETLKRLWEGWPCRGARQKPLRRPLRVSQAWHGVSVLETQGRPSSPSAAELIVGLQAAGPHVCLAGCPPPPHPASPPGHSFAEQLGNEISM